MMQNSTASIATEIQTHKRITLPSDAGNVTSLNRWRAASNEAGQGQEKISAPLSNEQLNNAPSDVNDYVQDIQRTIKFSIDGDAGETVIAVLDNETEEVVRQIPPEITFEIAEWLQSPVGVVIEDTM